MPPQSDEFDAFGFPLQVPCVPGGFVGAGSVGAGVGAPSPQSFIALPPKSQLLPSWS